MPQQDGKARMEWHSTRKGCSMLPFLGKGDITVLGLDGQVVRRHPTNDMLPTNLAFALPGKHRIHITEYEHGQMESLAVDCDGLPLWDGRKREMTREAHESTARG